MYKEQRCLSCNQVMVVEIYADESRYFCPKHPQVNKHEYKMILSDEMYEELAENSRLIRSRIFAGVSE